MLTDQEVARCEARLGPVALFMPTQPDGDYKLDLREFGDRQIVTLLLGKFQIAAESLVLRRGSLLQHGGRLEKRRASTAGIRAKPFPLRTLQSMLLRRLRTNERSPREENFRLS